MHLHIEYKTDDISEYCFLQLNLIFFFFFVIRFFLFGLTLWNEIFSIVNDTSIDLNWYQLPTVESIQKLLPTNIAIFSRFFFLFSVEWQSTFEEKEDWIDQQLLFSFFYLRVKFCWHPNICPINCILSLRQNLIEKHKIARIHSVNQSIRSIIIQKPHNTRWIIITKPN